MPEFFDTHAHLADEQLAPHLAQVLARAHAAGVRELLAVATHLETSRACVALARAHPGVYASVGLHPNYGQEAQPGDWSAIEQLAQLPEVVAVGETGLDRHWHDCPFELQQSNFARHLALSRTTGKPFIVHMRECEAETLAMLQAEFHRGGPLRGVMHSYTGTAAGAAECVRLGMYISFAGMITYKKSAELRQVAAEIPAARLLIETDCPYLSPEPVRGQRPNEPAYLVHTAACVAKLRGVSVEEIAMLTSTNAWALLGHSP